MKKIILILLLAICHIVSIAQRSKDLKINYMLRGHIYAQSSIVDSSALGGFGGSDNLPAKMNGQIDFKETGLFLKIDTLKTIVMGEKINGYKLYIGNKGDSIAELEASDSRLHVVAEVFFKNEWQPIEYLPSSWCGNSYHNVYLKPNEYWAFDIPKFSGKIKTKLRYRLSVGRSQYVYSNEIPTMINKGQLSNQKKYTPNGIMDPYNN